jgi:DNA ligase-1
MSEKLDGIRGYWDGDKLLTRSGERIHAPEWFTDCLPDFELDGELWAGRGRFHLVHTTVLDREPSEDWRQITYNVFEVPHASGDFPARLQKAKTWFEDHDCPHVRVVRQRICSGPDHLQRFVQRVRGKKGEGVIVKEPKTLYVELSRVHVLKVKVAEKMRGVVVAINPGQGMFRRMMGSLTVRLPTGKTFKLGTGFCREQREDPPQVGSRVLFEHHGWTVHNKPRFASFLKVVDEAESKP